MRDAEREGRAAPARREPVPREVLEPGRGDQGVRDDPRARPGQREALDFLKQIYEKRRDWEKLIGSTSARSNARRRGARARRRIEVAKLASEKLKKPAISIELWQKVARRRAEHRGARRAREALRAREGVGQAGRRLRAAGRPLTDDATRSVAMLREARHPLHREGRERAKATTPGRRCSQSSRTTGAPRTR